MPAPTVPRTVGIHVYGLTNNLLDDASVTIAFGSLTDTSNTNVKGEVIFDAGVVGAGVGDEITITATKAGEGTKSQTLILTTKPQTLDVTLEAAGNLSFYEDESGFDRYPCRAVFLVDSQGDLITVSNPLPIQSSDPLAGYHSTDLDRSDPEYHGYLKNDGSWYIVQYNRTTGARRFARGSSNYPTNFTNRANLTYEYFNEVF